MTSRNDEHASRTKKVKPTSLNLWVMTQVFKDGDEVPNRFTANRLNHLRRLVNAGLVEIVGSTVRLTAEGRAAMSAQTEGNDEAC
jgi:hypothetical protein